MSKYISEAIDFEENFSPEMRRAYERERKLERDRDKWYYNHGKGRYNLPLSTVLGERETSDNPDDESGQSSKFVSDGGRAAQTMYDLVNEVFTCTRQVHREKLVAAIKKIKRECPKALYTFLLIIKNGKNRKESICTIAERIKRFGAKQPVSIRSIWRALAWYLVSQNKKS